MFLVCSVFFVCYCVNCVLCLWLPLRRNKDKDIHICLGFYVVLCCNFMFSFIGSQEIG